MQHQDLLKDWDNFKHSIVVASLVALSMIGALIYGSDAEQKTRAQLESYVKTIQPIATDEKLAQLKTSQQDYSNPEWQKLKSDLVKIQDINSDIRYIYILKPQENKLFFVIDSESSLKQQTSNAPLAEPGEVYEDAPPEIWTSIAANQVNFMGPYQDKWGAFFSALNPIYDQNGKLIAILGVDIEAGVIIDQIKQRYIISIIMGIFLIATYIGIIKLHRKIQTNKK